MAAWEQWANQVEDGPGWVYLIHFERPLSPQHTTQHYLGWAKDVRRRLEEHRRGQGARLCEVATERGIKFHVVRVWRGGRDLERRLKNRHQAPKICPICGQRVGQLDLFLDTITVDDCRAIEF